MTSSSTLLRRRLRVADPDRYFCTLFAPAEKRQVLALLYLFNHELARAREVASEPVLALIRLNWWREVVAGIPKHHELATPLSAAIAAGALPREKLLGLITAREAETEENIPDLQAFLAYVRGTAGALARIAGGVLGVDSEVVEDWGTAYGITGILRAAPFLAHQNRFLLPADGAKVEPLIPPLLTRQPPREVLAAALPVVLARGGRWAVLRAAITGRV